MCEACGANTPAGEPSQPRRRPHEDLVRSVALSSDLVVSGSYDSTCRVWDIFRCKKAKATESGEEGSKGFTVECVSVLRGHFHQIYCVVLDAASGGRRIISGGLDTTVRVWDANSGYGFSSLLIKSRY